MRVLDLALAVVLAGGLALLTYLVVSLILRRHDRPAWTVRHYGRDGHTVVTAALTTRSGEILDEHVVAQIPDADPNWSHLFLEAREQAEERAFHLNT